MPLPIQWFAAAAAAEIGLVVLVADPVEAAPAGEPDRAAPKEPSSAAS